MLIAEAVLEEILKTIAQGVFKRITKRFSNENAWEINKRIIARILIFWKKNQDEFLKGFLKEYLTLAGCWDPYDPDWVEECKLRFRGAPSLTFKEG